MSDKKPSEETITLNLIFDDGEEEIEITMEQYLMIQDMANQSNMSFEEKFVELISKAAQEEEEKQDIMIAKAAQEVLEDNENVDKDK